MLWLTTVMGGFLQMESPPPPLGVSLSLATVWVFHLQPGLHLLDEGASVCLIWMLDLTGGSAATLTTGQIATGGGTEDPPDGTFIWF